MQETLLSFTPFPRLPQELQIKIWACSLEPPQVIPRIVQVNYSPHMASFTYAFPIPPALEVCHLSREAAQKVYIALVPRSTYPVYFNPTIDFLYCRPLPSIRDLNVRSLLPNQPIIPFIEAGTDVSAIHFLILDSDYWSYRAVANLNCPISELRGFVNLEDIFLRNPSLEQWRRTKEALFSRFLHGPDDPRFDLDAQYTAQVTRDAATISDVIPGFRIHLGGSGHIQEGELLRCFRGRNTLPEPQSALCANPLSFDEYWITRELPRISNIKAVHDS